MKQLSGLQLMQAMLNGDIPAPSITQTIPMKAIEVSEGTVIRWAAYTVALQQRLWTQ